MRSSIPRFLLAATLATLLLALAAAAPAQEQAQEQAQRNSIHVGDTTVYYNALPTTLLSPEVARQYGITRSSGRALLNVAVLRDIDGMETAVAATVSAAATNLNGQRQELRLREVREGDAIYYLGEARFQDRETLTFELEIAPAGVVQPIRTRFQQQFFAQ